MFQKESVRVDVCRNIAEAFGKYVSVAQENIFSRL